MVGFNHVGGQKNLRYIVVVLAEEFVVHKHQLALTDRGESLFFLCAFGTARKACFAHSDADGAARNEENVLAAVVKVAKHLAQRFNAPVIHFSVFIGKRRGADLDHGSLSAHKYTCFR